MGLGALNNALEILSAVMGSGSRSSYQKVILSKDTDTILASSGITDTVLGGALIASVDEAVNGTATPTAESLTLPVTPAKFEVGTAQGNRIVSITQIGEALIFGLPKLQTLSFTCFFPAMLHDYPFVVGDQKEPEECISQITKWREAREPIRVIITGSPVNMMMAIQNFKYQKQDGTGDYYYDLNLVEYKKLNTPAANNNASIDSSTGLKTRADNVQKPTTVSVVQKATDVLDAAKKAYGKYTHWRRIVESNDLKDLILNNPEKIGKEIKKLVIK